MKVLRVVANLLAPDPAGLAAFYREALGLTLRADMGWIQFLETGAEGAQQLQIASGGGSGTDLPAISVEVDDLDAALDAVRAAGGEVVYGPVSEPWGVRRFHLRDPAGNLVNVVTHEAADG
ncbi:glyoxalase [Rhodobacterales bacterium HKCCE2091]|nr:glyoxalase [Rhodobacterales bacterium HKCCE2091]